jgi:WD40 repeat protein
LNGSNHELSPFSTTKVHQNSIKCLDLAYTKSRSHVIVATGGDDNALGISVYSVNGLLKKCEDDIAPKIFMLRSAHGAAVTGLTCMPNSLKEAPDGGEYRIVSSSNDQRVKEWAITVDHGDNEIGVRIRKTGDVFTPVADVGDIACLQSGRKRLGDGTQSGKVLIVGNGMEVWNVGGFA